MLERHAQARYVRWALGWIACIWIAQASLAQSIPPVLNPINRQQTSVQQPALDRQEIPATASQWLSLRQTFVANFPKQIFAHPAKTDALLFQAGQDTVLVEFDSRRLVLRVEGAVKPVASLAKLALAHATESQVSRDRAFRLYRLAKQGQVAMAAFARGLESELPGGVSSATSVPAISAPVRLASGMQVQDKDPEQRFLSKRFPSDCRCLNLKGCRSRCCQNWTR